MQGTLTLVRGKLNGGQSHLFLPTTNRLDQANSFNSCFTLYLSISGVDCMKRWPSHRGFAVDSSENLSECLTLDLDVEELPRIFLVRSGRAVTRFIIVLSDPPPQTPFLSPPQRALVSTRPCRYFQRREGEKYQVVHSSG